MYRNQRLAVTQVYFQPVDGSPINDAAMSWALLWLDTDSTSNRLIVPIITMVATEVVVATFAHFWFPRFVLVSVSARSIIE